jgi:flagellar basal body-associated protein FliL
MNKVLGILSVASKVMMFIVTTVIAAISLTTAYIMFAPDEFPKPFRLVYNYASTPPAGQSETSTTTEGGSSKTNAEAVATPAPGSGMMFAMSTKIINLADPTGRKYVRVTVALEFMPDNPEYEKMNAEEKKTYEAEFQAKINARMPMMDDTVITTLSTKTFEDLYTAAGKEKVREELKKAIQEKMPDFSLMSIYFTEFVVQ